MQEEGLIHEENNQIQMPNAEPLFIASRLGAVLNSWFVIPSSLDIVIRRFHSYVDLAEKHEQRISRSQTRKLLDIGFTEELLEWIATSPNKMRDSSTPPGMT
jgi:hypothetical protein